MVELHHSNAHENISNAGNAVEANLVQISDCVCPGYEVIYECTVNATIGEQIVWGGTAVNCSESSGHITLIQPVNKDKERICNNGSVVARIVNKNNGYYTSQLRVMVSPNLIGQTVQCNHNRHTTSDVTVIGTKIILYRSG